MINSIKNNPANIVSISQNDVLANRPNFRANASNSLERTPQSDSFNDSQKEKKKSKGWIYAAGAGVLLIAAYFAGKKGWLGDSIKKFLGGAKDAAKETKTNAKDEAEEALRKAKAEAEAKAKAEAEAKAKAEAEARAKEKTEVDRTKHLSEKEKKYLEEAAAETPTAAEIEAHRNDLKKPLTKEQQAAIDEVNKTASEATAESHQIQNNLPDEVVAKLNKLTETGVVENGVTPKNTSFNHDGNVFTVSPEGKIISYKNKDGVELIEKYSNPTDAGDKTYKEMIDSMLKEHIASLKK